MEEKGGEQILTGESREVVSFQVLVDYSVRYHMQLLGISEERWKKYNEKIDK